MSYPISELASGLYSIAIHGCRADAAIRIVSPECPFVLVRDHSPIPSIEWTQAAVGLSRESILKPTIQRVRALRFDVLMTTVEFIGELSSFKGQGICLQQLSKEPADTHFLQSEPKSALDFNTAGIELLFVLPHEMETGVVYAASLEAIRSVRLRLLGYQ